MAIHPVSVGLSLCNYLFVEDRSKNVALVGLFQTVKAPSFPVMAAPFHIFSALTGGLGDVTMRLVVTRLDTDEDFAIYQAKMHFPDKLQTQHFHLRMTQFVYPAATSYQFTLLADGEWLAQCRIRAYQAEI